MNPRSGIGRVLIGCIAVGLAAFATPAWSAGQSSHEVVWGHPNPASVSRFVVFISSVKGDSSSARRVDVPKPENQSSGTFQTFSAIVSMRDTEFVSVAAVGYTGQMGALSNWSGVVPGRPGQPIVIEP